MEEILQKLVDHGIQLLPAAELTTHFVFERDGFIALVERRGNGLGHAGAPGLLCPQGMAQLIWRGERGFFVTKGFERLATADEVERLRSFGQDLEICLTR